MSSLKNAAKSQKTHRERSQPATRSHLGILEKKKDYRQRADDFHKKQNTIKALKRKALDKNPDEFYFKMVKTALKDGVHEAEDETPEYTEDQLKMMQTQDLRYVNYKRSTELKKIERLKGELHMLDAPKPRNTHIIFVDTKKEAKELDVAKHLDTHPALLGRTYNRPRMELLRKAKLENQLDKETLEKLQTERGKKYKQLAKRIEREKQLHIIAQKMEIKKHLMDKRSRKKKIKRDTPDAPAVYKWVPKRQK